MGRLLAIDYGRRRCGIAVTDPLRIVATALTTVAAGELLPYVTRYVAENQVDAIIVGLPRQLDGSPSESMRYIEPALGRLRHALPEMPVVMWDERFTSTLAHKAMIEGGFARKTRQDKGAIDRMAAVIILNSYLDSLK